MSVFDDIQNPNFMEKKLSGLIIRAQSGFLTVRTQDGDYTCRLRGKLKRGKVQGDIAAVGDHVRITAYEDGSGTIDTVEPRQHLLSRQLSGIKREYQQILLANPDQVVFVFACAEPDPHLRMLDRFLVIAERQGIPPIIVANKVDLTGLDTAQEIFGLYRELDYPLIYTSVVTKRGVDELHKRLLGKVSAFAGPSGVGKSSLLNAVQPKLGLAVRSVSESTSKGRHTTQVRELFPLDGGGYVADMPGLRTLALWDTEPEELDAYFREMRELVRECRFSDCTHRSEPGCAVREAVSTGKVNAERYESYLHLRYGGEYDERTFASNIDKLP